MVLKVKEKQCELDSTLWKMVVVDGYPVAALYLNGHEFSLAGEFADDLEKLITDYIREKWAPRSDE